MTDARQQRIRQAYEKKPSVTVENAVLDKVSATNMQKLLTIARRCQISIVCKEMETDVS